MSKVSRVSARIISLVVVTFFLSFVFAQIAFATGHDGSRQALPGVNIFSKLFAPGFDMSADTVDCSYVKVDACGCKMEMKGNPPKCQPSPNMHKCPCKSKVAPAGGICIAMQNCQGTSFQDQEGKTQSPGDSKGMGDMLKQVMDMLKQAMQQKGGGDQQQQPQQQQQAQLCPQGTYQVTTPSGDPCAVYVPPTSQSLLGANQNAASDLLKSLGLSSDLSSALTSGLRDEGESALSESDLGLDGSGTNVSDQVLANLTGNAADTGTADGAKDKSSTSTVTSTTGRLADQALNLRSGTSSDIEITDKGVTFTAKTRDEETNVEVAGFYGSDTFGAESEGVIARLCRNRPWANMIVSYVIPPAFFDSLCAWRGYEVGTPAPAPVPRTGATQVKKPAPLAATTTLARPPLVPPEVDIWAVPEKVPLGTRTSVFWNTKGVESCTVTSTDGSFNETTLSGGAATVPLSGATEFTISCATSDGQTVADSVTVNLSI